MNQISLSMLTESLVASAPVASLGAAAMVVLLVGAFWSGSARLMVPLLALLGIVVTGAITVAQGAAMLAGESGGVLLDGFTIVFDLLILAATAVAVLISPQYLEREGLERPEYYCLMLFSASGAMLMASASNLMVMFLGLELLSIPLYVLAGFARQKAESEESALKYFLLGSFASAIFIFGASLVYVMMGDVSIGSVMEAFATAPEAPLAGVGVAMVVAGLAFKIALVPFHMWTPDVYEGAPTSVTAFMAVVAKAAGFGALVRLGLGQAQGDTVALAWALSAATMIWGNLLAVTQVNVKRMLAYSSIGHAGYLLMGLLPGTQQAVSAVLYYIAAYGATVIGAFAVAMLLAGKGDRYENIPDLRGVARREPFLAAAMAVFMLSLAGIPLFAGFFAKLFVFMAAVQGGFVGLAVIGALTSVVAVYYYLRVTVAMWMEEPSGAPEQVEAAGLTRFVVAALVVLVTAMGVFSSPIVRMTSGAAGAAVSSSSGQASSLR